MGWEEAHYEISLYVATEDTQVEDGEIQNSFLL